MFLLAKKLAARVEIESAHVPMTAAQLRFLEIMRRHVETDDVHLSDDELVRAVMRRYEKARQDYLIDPNE